MPIRHLQTSNRRLPIPFPKMQYRNPNPYLRYIYLLLFERQQASVLCFQGFVTLGSIFLRSFMNASFLSAVSLFILRSCSSTAVFQLDLSPVPSSLFDTPHIECDAKTVIFGCFVMNAVHIWNICIFTQFLLSDFCKNIFRLNPGRK